MVNGLGIDNSDNPDELRPAPRLRRRTTGFLTQTRSNSETKQTTQKILGNEEIAEIQNLHFDYSRFRKKDNHQLFPTKQLIKDFAITLKKAGCK